MARELADAMITPVFLQLSSPANYLQRQLVFPEKHRDFFFK
jgi:hypothetical protein